MSEKYPKPDDSYCGCKVSWYYYKDKKKAEQASAAAEREAERLWNLGFEFGFMCPGVMRLRADGPRAGMYEVVIP